LYAHMNNKTIKKKRKQILRCKGHHIVVVIILNTTNRDIHCFSSKVDMINHH
jgi:hypothetical protein